MHISHTYAVVLREFSMLWWVHWWHKPDLCTGLYYLAHGLTLLGNLISRHGPACRFWSLFSSWNSRPSLFCWLYTSCSFHRWGVPDVIVLKETNVTKSGHLSTQAQKCLLSGVEILNSECRLDMALSFFIMACFSELVLKLGLGYVAPAQSVTAQACTS